MHEVPFKVRYVESEALVDTSEEQTESWRLEF